MRELTGREINEANGVGAFLNRWLGEAPALSFVPDEPRRAETGNINLAATTGSSPSMLLAPLDARFVDFIEPAVSPLVAAVIAAGWISYTSCEGHRYPDGTADELHVGLIPRNAQERAAIEAIWQAVGQSWERKFAGDAIEFALMRSTVHCDGKIDLPTLDLYICRNADRSWNDYFVGREAAVRHAASLIVAAQG